MKKNLCALVFGLVSIMSMNAHASEGVHLDKAPGNLHDQPSLQRGATLYVNNCLGCHSLQHIRYEQMAKDIGITDKDGNVLKDLVMKKLNFNGEKITDPMTSAIDKNAAAHWFGKPPPDLSLVARSRGVDWLYTYLRSFYKDDSKAWGVNNVVFKDVGMPHALLNLQGVQEAVTEKVTVGEGDNAVTTEVIKSLKLTKPGLLSPVEYDKAVADLVNFLDYVGEPHKLERKRMGGFVLLFMFVFIIFSYLLKREYWRDVH